MRTPEGKTVFCGDGKNPRDNSPFVRRSLRRDDPKERELAELSERRDNEYEEEQEELSITICKSTICATKRQ
jgi:hypothetical protein